MTNFNSGFNPNFNFNPALNPSINNANNHANIYRQSFIQQNAINNAQNSLQNLAQENVQNKQAENSAETVSKALLYDYNQAKMDSEVLLKYLRNVMKMPENINKLIDTLESPILKALIGKNIDVKALVQTLNSNSTDAIERVLKTISESLKAGVHDVSQLKDVLNILSVIQNTTSSNAVKELLLLYIPVNPPIFDKNVDFKTDSPEEESAINNSDFTLIFETVNFSNISCCINSYDNKLYIQLFCDKNFPFDKFKQVVDIFKREMNLRVELEENIVKREEENKERIRNFNILTTGFVSFDVLIMAHLIVKTVFKIDETFEIKNTAG